MIITKVFRLPREDEVGSTIVRMCNSRISANGDSTRQKFGRRKPLVIQNLDNGFWVLRYAMGNPGTIALKSDEIALDYDALSVLDIKHKDTVNLNAREAKKSEVFRHFWDHPDLNVRISMRLSIWGTALGIVGLLTGILPFLLA